LGGLPFDPNRFSTACIIKSPTNPASMPLVVATQLMIFNASHGLLKFRSLDDSLIGTNGDQRTFQISFTPLKQMTYSQSLLSGYQRNRASWFIGLFDDFKLSLDSPAPAALNTGDHFHPVRSY
jgi:hypothetical protein